MGFVTRDQLKRSIGKAPVSNLAARSNECVDNVLSEQRSRACVFAPSFISSSASEEHLDFSSVLETSVLHLRKEVPQELVVKMFQKLVSIFGPSVLWLTISQSLRQILFTHSGKLEGMVTKTDVAALLRSHFPHTGALKDDAPTWHR